MQVVSRTRRWPVLKQLRGDPFGLAKAARSKATSQLGPRTRKAERVAQSVCPYCAVGCGQLVYVEDGKVSQIEGDPASPISRGRLCPKGAASKGLVTSPLHPYTFALLSACKTGDPTNAVVENAYS